MLFLHLYAIAVTLIVLLVPVSGPVAYGLIGFWFALLLVLWIRNRLTRGVPVGYARVWIDGQNVVCRVVKQTPEYYYVKHDEQIWMVPR